MSKGNRAIANIKEDVFIYLHIVRFFELFYSEALIITPFRL
ncbi:hypothetical protein ACN23B_08270 [Anabaena sp. FACHB-709]|nr:hypothetical protein [Nostoc sp. PCC 7120 = FACHB-418]